jgi:methyltransferase family protein
VSAIVACPLCQQDLRADRPAVPTVLTCSGCATRFQANGDGVLDLRGKGAKTHVLRVETGSAEYGPLLDGVTHGPLPVTYAGPLPERTSPQFLSVIAETVPSSGLVLEIGGGSGWYRRPVLELGFRFLTTDYASAGADLLADAHALPFRSSSADALLMQAVSQAFENPFVAFREVDRVVKGGGIVLGTIDCCAIFASSFYNITPWGLLSVLRGTDLTLEQIWTTKDALEYCGTNPGYPQLVKPILRGLSRISRLPLLTPRNLWRGRKADPFVTAGSIAFLARKRPLKTAAPLARS